MPIARVGKYHGEPSILIDGVPYPPMTITVATPGATSLTSKRRPFSAIPDYLHRLGEAGLRIFYVTTSTQWNQPGDPARGIPDDLEQAMRDIDVLMEAVPDAWVILRLNVSPPVSWIHEHPEELVRFSDGKTRPLFCTSVSREVPIEGMFSLCSEAWRRDADKALAEYFDALEKSRHFSRVIGFFLCSGGTSEWYYPQGLVNEDGSYGDFSEPFRRQFGSFLRTKYGTEEALRRAWGKPDASFEHPAIPLPEEREFVYKADEKIINALRNWENQPRAIGMKIDMDAREDANLGVFLNVNRYAHVADFFDAWHEGTAESIVHFAGTLKARYPDLLVGAFYGSYGCTDYFDGSTASATLTIMNSGKVDFLAAPGVYNNREPGGIVAQREMQDSFRLRGQMYVCEDDSRTHLCEPWMQRDAMALYSVEDSINTLKRDFARDICEDVQGWWFDMGNGWYDDPRILALFSRQKEIADFAYARPDRAKHNEIALIYDAESIHRVSAAASRLVTDFYRTSDLGRIGAPVDYYFHDDMARPDMPDYKLYIMLNVYCLTEAEREAIFQKARRNHAVVLWLYAPGFIDSGRERPMDVENIERTVGMHVRLIDRTFFPHFRVDPKSHPALALASPSRRYGIIDRDVHSNIWIGASALSPAFVNPGFCVDDPQATVLGRYCHSGECAMALTEKDGFTSIYCAAQVLRSDLIASLAAYAGCHLYSHSDDVLYANRHFVAVHAQDDGRRTIYFPGPCSPFEVYERRYYGHGVTKIEVDMTLGETKMWSLSGEF